MSREVKPPRTLVWVTIIILILIGAVAFCLCRTELPDSIKINAKGQPTIGYARAPVHVVVFEEPKCIHCKQFNDEIFPKIKEKYIDTNKARYTVIPVSFLPQSMPAAVALLCIYKADPVYPNNDLFFTYLDYIYHHLPDKSVDWAKTETLLDFAHKASPAINLQKLKKCVEAGAYRSKIEKNTSYGAHLMGGVITTPTVFVNGMQVKELTVDGVSHLIDEVLKHHGVKTP